MHADYLEDGTVVVFGASNKLIFNRIWAGVGWPDQDAGHICVVGERTADNLYHCLWEKHGGLWELGDAALEVKKRFLIDCIWVDARDTISTSYLRTLEGLCFHPELGTKLPMGMSKAVSPGRRKAPLTARDGTAAIAPVQERIWANYRSALEKTRGVIMTGRLFVHETHCPQTVYTLRQPLEQLLKSTVMMALVWVVTALENTRGNLTEAREPQDSWYGNLSRNSRGL